ncbi:MAG: SIS domain-containing protein [Pseudomonadota bacterium]|nr:SIS domain-containing protein [Pseudomonadota bacterium]
MTFPDQKYTSSDIFVDAYFDQYVMAAASVDREKVQDAINILEKTYKTTGTLYVCGNGGSASISNHLACDHGKLLSTGTELLPHIQSLSTNVEVITAIANDISYDDVFLLQLKLIGKPGDVLMTVSSSGDSENVVRAAIWAKENGMEVISLTGFDGGRTSNIAGVNIHVDAKNYGVVEDVHQSLMHLIGQYLRQAHMAETSIKKTLF